MVLYINNMTWCSTKGIQHDTYKITSCQHNSVSSQPPVRIHRTRLVPSVKRACDILSCPILHINTCTSIAICRNNSKSLQYTHLYKRKNVNTYDEFLHEWIQHAVGGVLELYDTQFRSSRITGPRQLS
jgi:hypothetical protein